MGLYFFVKGQKLTRKDEAKIAGFARNYIHAKFNFDCSWIDLYKYAIFSEPDGTKHVITLGYGKELSCKVPEDVLKNTIFYVSVFADDLFTSTQESVLVAPSGYVSEIDDLEEGEVVDGEDDISMLSYEHRDDEYPYERINRFEKVEHPYI